MPDFSPAITYVKNTFVVSDLLQSAYRLAHALKHPGQGISPSESKEGLDTLNAMIDGWKMEDLLINITRRSVQNMVANQKVYGVGPGQDFDLERPEKIHRAGFIVGTTPNVSEIPMRIILTYEEYAAYVNKNTGSTIPLALYYQATAPFGSATFWPVPTVASQIAIYTPQFLSEFSTVDDAVEAPDGYRDMIMYNLAVRVHQLYPDKPMDSSVTEFASYYKQRVKNHQATPLFIGSDQAVMQESRAGKWAGGMPKTWTPY